MLKKTSLNLSQPLKNKMNAIHLSDQSINALDPTTVVVTVLSGWPKVMVSRYLDDILKDYSQVFKNGTN